jgi:cytochrome c oxidase cbb3-type subunit 4
MTLDFLRILGTVLAFVAFIAICLWAYSSKRRDAFDQAANLPFADEANDVSDELTPGKENAA